MRERRGGGITKCFRVDNFKPWGPKAFLAEYRLSPV